MVYAGRMDGAGRYEKAAEVIKTDLRGAGNGG